MIHGDWTVTPDDDGIRPAGKPDECLYCRQRVGGTHMAECVIRKRTVVVRVTLDLVLKHPESWDEDSIEFHHNESSTCKSNLVRAVDELDERLRASGGCLCSIARVEYVREATEEDEEAQNIRAADRERKRVEG